MNFIYPLYIFILLFCSSFNHLTHCMNANNQVTLRFKADNNIQQEYNKEIVKKSETLAHLLEMYKSTCDLSVTHTADKPSMWNRHTKENSLPITLCNKKIFDEIYIGMSQLNTNESDRVKTFNISALYAQKTPDELIPLLSAANVLDIPALTKNLTSCIAKKVNTFTPKEQNLFFKTHVESLSEKQLQKDIFAGITTKDPILKEISRPYSEIKKESEIFSPCKKFKYNKTTKKVTICSSGQVINNEFIEAYFSNKAFHKKDIFNQDGTQLLTYSKTASSTDQQVYIIDTATNKILKYIDTPDIFEKISFCASNKLCLQYKKEKDNTTYTLELADSTTNNNYCNIPFHNIKTHAVNPLENSLVTCSDDIHNNAVLTVINTTTNQQRKIPLYCSLSNTTIMFNPDNTTFTVCGEKTENMYHVFLCTTTGSCASLISFECPTLPHLLWSPSGDYLVYEHEDQHSGGKTRTVGYVSILDSKRTILWNNFANEINYICTSIHPTQDIIFVQDNWGTLKIFDLTKDTDAHLIANYNNTKFTINERIGSSRSAISYLSQNKKLLLIKDSKNSFVINIHTSSKIFECSSKNHRVYWQDEYLVVDKSSLWECIKDYPSDGWVPYKKYQLNYDNLEDKNYISYYIGGGVGLTLIALIALYAYKSETSHTWLESFKQLFLKK